MLHHQIILFTVQIIVLFVVICVSIANLTLGTDDRNLWIALLTSCLGYIMPNPKINIREANNNRSSIIGIDSSENEQTQRIQQIG